MSGNSQTTLTSSSKDVTPAFKVYNCVAPAIEPKVYTISAPESCVNFTDFEGQSMLALCYTRQSMPKMTSMSEWVNTINEAEKRSPWI